MKLRVWRSVYSEVVTRYSLINGASIINSHITQIFYSPWQVQWYTLYSVWNRQNLTYLILFLDPLHFMGCMSSMIFLIYRNTFHFSTYFTSILYEYNWKYCFDNILIREAFSPIIIRRKFNNLKSYKRSFVIIRFLSPSVGICLHIFRRPLSRKTTQIWCIIYSSTVFTILSIGGASNRRISYADYVGLVDCNKVFSQTNRASVSEEVGGGGVVIVELKVEHWRFNIDEFKNLLYFIECV